MGKNDKIKRKGESKSKKQSDEKTPASPKINPETLKDLVLKDCFRFQNGDAYVGGFSLDEDCNIFRHGKGKYFSTDGHVLGGQWQNDVLVYADRISYPDGSWYRGPLENGQYSGVGVYYTPQLGSLDCDFVRGRPQGFVTFTDLDGFRWQGQSSGATGSVTLVPRNHFFDSEDVISKSLTQKKSNSPKLSSSMDKNSLNLGLQSAKSS